MDLTTGPHFLLCSYMANLQMALYICKLVTGSIAIWDERPFLKKKKSNANLLRTDAFVKYNKN